MNSRICSPRFIRVDPQIVTEETKKQLFFLHNFLGSFLDFYKITYKNSLKQTVSFVTAVFFGLLRYKEDRAR